MSAGPTEEDVAAGRARSRTSGRARTPALTPALVSIGLVTVVAAVAAGTAGGWMLHPRIWFDGITLSGEQTPPMMDPPTQPPPLAQAGPVQQWIGWALAGLVGVATLAGLFFLARALWRRRPRRAVVVEEKPDSTPAGVIATEPDLPALLRGADAAEEILAEASGVPRDLVLRCWLALEEAAAASGAARKPSDSPTEFTASVLRATHTDQASVDTLLHLYHQARFSSHSITDSDVRAARSAVIRLAATWRGFDTAMRHTVRTDP